MSSTLTLLLLHNLAEPLCSPRVAGQIYSTTQDLSLLNHSLNTSLSQTTLSRSPSVPYAGTSDLLWRERDVTSCLAALNSVPVSHWLVVVIVSYMSTL